MIGWSFPIHSRILQNRGKGVVGLSVALVEVSNRRRARRGNLEKIIFNNFGLDESDEQDEIFAILSIL